ncbi:MAG: Ig-like domain-containing protein, partial [Anaerolineales bacterium]|nr:Ig-like domain-containing protein [Anaerolineales bacterium]
PAPFSYIRGRIEITGTVKVENFAFFRLQYGKGLNPTEYIQIEGDRYEQIENGWLQFWNTEGLDGLYTLQLVAVKNDPEGGPFQFETATVPVTVDNRPPTVTLLAPAPNQTYTLQDEAIVIQPQVQDNLAVAQVEFYVDGTLFQTVTAPPYSTRWRLTEAARGTRRFHVRVVDAAGNFAESQSVSVIIR